MKTRRHLAAGAALVGAIALVLFALRWLAPSSDLPAVVIAFWHGSLGTVSSLVSGTLVRLVPLALIGVGLCVAFRAGVFNIGAEGQLMMGAVAATSVGLMRPFGPVQVVAALVAGAAGGAAWAGLAAVLKRRFGVLEVISTLLLNFVAANLVAYLVRGPLQEPTHAYPQSELIAASSRLLRFSPNARLHVGIVLVPIACVLCWWFLRHTAAGFRIRVVGASPRAAAVVGRVNVPRVSFNALVVSGALAGLAGAIEVSGVTFALYENLSPGYGFAGIAVAILAGLNPLLVMGTALLFATLEAGALGMQRDAGVPAAVASALEATVILGTLLVAAWLARTTQREAGA